MGLLDKLLGKDKQAEEEAKAKQEAAAKAAAEEAARKRREELAEKQRMIEESKKRADEELAKRKAEAEAEAEKMRLKSEAMAAAMRKSVEAEAPKTYVVKSGDSLSKIAKEVLGDAKRWPELYELNKALIGDNPNLIHPGQELKLPK